MTAVGGTVLLWTAIGMAPLSLEDGFLFRLVR